MKTCITCKQEKPLDNFGNNRTRVDGKQRYCRLCAKASNAAHYKKDPVKRRALTLAAQVVARQFIWDHLARNPCTDCGEPDPVVLQFDHVKGVKLFNLSEAPTQGRSLETIKAEIAKCEVRCANCHIRQTALRAGWYKGIVTTRASIAEMV